ncbi:MAG: NAD-glutamate dehydrogenase domain-containing protein [Nitriliruptoraceae bacterium]
MTALDSTSSHPDPLLRDLADAILRRVDDHDLDTADPPAVARWIAAVLDRIRPLEPGTHRVTVSRPATGLDGRTPGPTVVELLCDDRPFLLSTVTDELARQGHRVQRVWHPIVGTAHANGELTGVVPARTAERRLLVLRVEVEPWPRGEDIAVTAERIERLVADVVRATDDFGAMHERLTDLATQLRFGAWAASDDHDTGELADLVDWLLDDNLVLLGVRDYHVVPDAQGRQTLEVVAGSGLGLLRDTTASRFATPVPLEELPAAHRAQLTGTELLSVGRTRSQSTVQRRDRMQDFRIRRHDETVHETRILGLFTRRALSEPAATVPVLRQRLHAILEREDVVDGSSDETALTSLFEALPKDELFHAPLDVLHTMLADLLRGEERDEVRSLVRIDEPSSTASVMVAVPRDRYGPQLRERLSAHLAERFGSERVDVDLSLGDRPDVIARFLVHLDGPLPEVDVATLRDEIRRLSRSWFDDVVDQIGDDATRRAIAERFPAGYRDTIPVEDAVRDVALLDRLCADSPVVVELRPSAANGDVRVRVARRGAAVELSSFMPVLESLGLVVIEEIPHRLDDPDEPLHLHDFGVRTRGLDPHRDGARVADTILAAWHGHLTVDLLNALVVDAGLQWRQVTVLRAYRRLRRQLGTTFTSEYVNQTLVGNAEVTRRIVEFFEARFDPDRQGDPGAGDRAHRAAIEACDELSRLDHDRILRGFVELVAATVRTNAFRHDATADGSGEPYVSLKFDPSLIQGVARPVAHREVFVHSPRVEGIHLRFGPVARGGLRWSDRRDDVRDEVFDLVRAQVLKNALIVPTGAKGGFVVRDEPEDPTELRDEATRQYVTFVRGLLDVTDDLDGERVVNPPRVVCHDGPDPYLVVAADRGTATLSDTANGIAQRYGFWLDDAFASGGSAGYDHKELGVTARGAWLMVRRHFRELGIDVQTEPVSVVGVGDMSGDVFGNGLLRSRAVRLVAAFDHRHVFLDPDPDPGRSFEERERLFTLPRSNWDDYDRSLLSTGGGVFARDARSIPLSDEVRALLRVDVAALSPPALIRAILCAPVDLLFAGGIGTYVKAATERSEDVGDRANAELRVDGRDLRARVIAEGANLLITQPGRIEFARRGGRVNQDAIDNAAGVATSDCEVNLKILLRLAVEQGVLAPEDRDATLASLADEVVDLVMQMVDRQGAGVSREFARSASRLDAYDRMLDRLTDRHDLDREVERLPSSDELAERASLDAGMTRPEVASLIAWAKRDLKETLLAQPLADAQLLDNAITDQFPAGAVTRFGSLLAQHRLRRELIATSIANDVVDRMGVTFVHEVADVTGAPVVDVVVAHRIAHDVLDTPRLWELVDAMESTHDTARIRDIDNDLEATIRAITTGLVDDPRVRTDPDAALARLQAVCTDLRTHLIDLGTSTQRRARAAHLRWLIDDLVDPDLANVLAVARDLRVLPEVADVVASTGRGTTDVMHVFLLLGEQLAVDDLEALAARIHPQGAWQQRQIDGVVGDLRHARHDAAVSALRGHPEGTPAEAVARFVDTRRDALERARRVVAQLDHGHPSLADAVAVGARLVGRALA